MTSWFIWSHRVSSHVTNAHIISIWCCTELSVLLHLNHAQGTRHCSSVRRRGSYVTAAGGCIMLAKKSLEGEDHKNAQKKSAEMHREKEVEKLQKQKATGATADRTPDFFDTLHYANETLYHWVTAPFTSPMKTIDLVEGESPYFNLYGWFPSIIFCRGSPGQTSTPHWFKPDDRATLSEHQQHSVRPLDL